MIAPRTALSIKALIIISYVLYSLPATAQLSAAVRYKLPVSDTSARASSYYNDADFAENSLPASNHMSKDEASREESMEAQLDTKVGRTRLMGYLKEISANNSQVNYNEAKVKIYYRLANVFARLRLYPLAMKCFFKTMANSNNQPADSKNTIPADTAERDVTVNPGYLSINTTDDSVFVNDPTPPNKKAKKSKAITYQRIVNTFNDGKKAVAYALLFHVKQPVPGKPKVFVWANTGHTFITLIKYNSDSSSVSISFGFYPKKDNLFSATPWDPTCTGTFKNDNAHEWDEVVGKFISARKFNRILKLTKDYDGLEYQLSKNNCTDFAIKAASYAGFGITNTAGSWPLGHGNTPAITGQSIIQGGVYDAHNQRDLFINYEESLNRK
ncbi:hypothetical protein SAMN05216464_102457 [Mucilaginibacter pineti]|uniref:Uncharacterized protein n=1 Tax=Mucilaginibacter pineti TaxID=1391627 RepID=A0A1G6XCG0_9SPHI|nr:hypothetical protein [Mucilaginibacter pineti]SDD74976.1 hypothetical protein SAMN05216464_102457 [Mucilaginibacter pineti]